MSAHNKIQPVATVELHDAFKVMQNHGLRSGIDVEEKQIHQIRCRPDMCDQSSVHSGRAHGNERNGREIVHCTTDELRTLFKTIDAMRERIRELEVLNSMDELTGIANRRGLMRRLGEQIKRARRGAGLVLAIVDIDHFKRVNDSYGHAVGDSVLAAVAQALVRSCRQLDFVARLGGEEFCVLYEGSSLESAHEVAERQRKTIEQLQNGIGKISVSIGLAEYGPPDNGDTLLARADAALYQAKEAGRNLIRTAA